MWHRLLAAGFGILLLAGPAAHAETLSNSRDLKPDSEIGRYLRSQEMMKGLFGAAVQMDRNLGLSCGSGYDLRPLGIIVFTPIEMSAGSSQPEAGAWLYRYDAVRCQDTKRYNVMVTARSGGSPRISLLPPGNTIVSPDLLEETIPAASKQAAKQAGQACKDIKVFDTTVTRQPEAQQQGNAVSPGSWRERWTLLACGKRVDVPLIFTPDGQGGTKVAVGE